MAPTLLGIHHVTAIAGDPATNLAFYTRVLGLRLVKRTVNFDDPTTWHLYFGDRLGRPGTNMTFFPHPQARPGEPGSGEVGCTAFAIPPGTRTAWRQRLEAEKLDVQQTTLHDQPAVTFADPHGTRLALIERPPSGDAEPWTGGDLPAELAIHGFDHVRLGVRDPKATATFLAGVLGMREFADISGHHWLDPGGGGPPEPEGPGQRIEVAPAVNAPARLGAGSVHHVAFRVADDEAQRVMRRRLIDAGVGVTEVQDRQYFHSIYFREPGGVLCEIATDGPGFTLDEPEAELGQQLRLPPWLEPRRDELEQALPPLTQENAR